MNKKQKKQDLLRLIVQCISFMFHNGYVRGWVKGNIYTGDNKAFCVPGLNCYSCPGAIGACPIGSLQAVLDSGQYKFSMYVLGFIGAVGLFCGRFVCGWLCPFGLVQDLLHRIPIGKKVKNLPGHKYLKYLRFVILALFVIILPMTVMNQAGMGQPWFCEYICPSGTLLGGIPLVLANANLRSAIGFRFAWKVALLILVIVISVRYYRPFCKYVCPLGALYGACNPVSIYRLKVDKDTCVTCGACQKACGMDIKVWEKPNSMDCIRCGKCMAACPTGAISSTFTRKKKDAAPEVQASAEETMTSSVENVTADSTQAAAAESTATAKTGTGKKVGAVITGILGIICGIAFLGMYAYYLYAIAASGSVGEPLTFSEYILPYMVMAVPATMTIIFGVNLIRSVKKGQDLLELRSWPKKLFLTDLVSLAITYVLFYILLLFITGTFSIAPLMFTSAAVVMMVAWIGGAAIAVVSLIAHLVLRK